MPFAAAMPRVASELRDIDFTLSSSLPPMIAGDLTGEIELSVPYLYAKPGVMCAMRYLRDRQSEPLFAVSMLWWGEGGLGTVLKPDLLHGRDEHGEQARQTRLSKATCALFPVRCGLDGLVAYLKDMGNITLDVLVHEGEPRRARNAGRCVIPVGGWGGQLNARQGFRDGNVVAEGYFPVISLDGKKHAGDLRVRLRACLGPSSRLRKVLAVAKMVVDKTSIGAETQDMVNILDADSGMTVPTGIGPNKSVEGEDNRRFQEISKNGRSRSGVRPASQVRELSARASFDSDDPSDGLNADSPAAANRHAQASGPLMSSFQLNEALAKFDESDTMPVWPNPRGSLYRPPETHGEAPPMLRDGKSTKGSLSSIIKVHVNGGKKSSAMSSSNPRKVRKSPPTRVGETLTSKTKTSGIVAGAPPEEVAGKKQKRVFASSISPKRQAPGPNPEHTKNALTGFSGSDQNRVHAAEGHGSVPGASTSPHPRATVPPTDELTSNGLYLSELLNRGKDLKEKMTSISGNDAQLPVSATLVPSLSKASLPVVGTSNLVDLVSRPGLISGALLGSSLRDDIEGIFDTLSENDAAVHEAGMLVRDPEARGHEDRVVNLLLEAAGPPPSSLAFPALAAVERQRAESLARVRFLRIRLSRLVMFGSMASASEGHGWQIRFRLPSFASPPGQRSTGHPVAGALTSAESGGNARNPRVVTLPVPPRVPTSSLGKGKTARRGGPRSGATRSTGSTLRVRRGFGASDLVIGETPLLEEVICTVNIDDVCVRHWMDAVVEFLLVDGKTDGPAPHRHPLQHKPRRQRAEPSTVGPGDRVAAVATLSLRDLLLSAELGVVATLDLTEVSDFWVTEDARAAAAGYRGRGGRALRNPYRSQATTSASCPLVLGDRAVGALGVALELVPGEADVSPEHSRPQVERWSTVRQDEDQGSERVRRGVVENSLRGDGSDGVLTSDVGTLMRPTSNRSTEWKISSPPSAEVAPQDGAVETYEVPVAKGYTPKDKIPQIYVEGNSGGAELTVSPSASPPGLEGAWREVNKNFPGGKPGNEFSVMLRIKDLKLAPTVGSMVEEVRVAYSFTQQTMERQTPTVIYRSVSGSRVPPQFHGGDSHHVSPFALEHQEIFPFPAESNIWRLEAANASRVFEVWGSAGSAVVGRGEALLGLAKIPLRPFEGFTETERGMGAANDGTNGSLAVAADGPVAIVDPFSGKAVGELHFFFALGTSPTISALAALGAESGDVAEVAGSDIGGTLDHLSTAVHRETPREEGKKEEATGEELEGGGRSEMGGVLQGGDKRAGEDGLSFFFVHEEPVALDDSVVELSMLLNPGRAERSKVDSARNSGGFTGLVRHVIELSVVGELPLSLEAPLDAGTGEQEHADEPVGCAIEYSLPTGQASLDISADDTDTLCGTSQTHELWWDADSGILNSRARHITKVPGSMLDKDNLLPSNLNKDETEVYYHGEEKKHEADKAIAGHNRPAAPQNRQLNDLLDCMFGRGDLVLSLFWRSSEAGAEAGHREAWGSCREGEVEGKARVNHQRQALGTAILRRVDLLPLVRWASASRVLRIPIQPTNANNGGMPPPEALPLSISYRREPSAVARRKSHGLSGRRDGMKQAGDVLGDVRRDCEEGKEHDQELSSSRDMNNALTQHAGKPNLDHPLALGGGGAMIGEAREGTGEKGSTSMGDGHVLSLNGSASPKQGVETPEGSLGRSVSADSDSAGSWDSKTNTVLHQSNRTEHLLPARTKVCVRVKGVTLTDDFPGVVALARTQDLLVWLSFNFPRFEGYKGQGEREPGNNHLWKKGAVDAGGQEVHWSPTCAVSREEGRDWVPFEWSFELPVTINAAFVEYVHTQSLKLRVWRGRRDDWPKAGTAYGVAQVALSSLLTTLGGIAGDIIITPESGHDSRRTGSIAVRMFFKHRGLVPDDPDEHKLEMALVVDDDGDADACTPVPGFLRREGGKLDDLEDPSGGIETHNDGSRGAASGQALSYEVPFRPQDKLTVQTPQRQLSGGKLRVYVERAMRLLRPVPKDAEARVSSGILPSTYVTFRWEEGGKPPMVSPLAFETVVSGVQRLGNTGVSKGLLEGNGEAITPIVENTANPVFHHAAEMHLSGPEVWSRVCGPSAALVFRVWRRARCSWWDIPETSPTEAQALASFGGRRVGCGASTTGSHFGDKLIGSAVVGLEVLRGAVGGREGLGLREIDGWYHVLDDLQRPQGQIKVQVRPESPASTSGQEARSSGHASVLLDPTLVENTRDDQPFGPLSYGPSLVSESAQDVKDETRLDSSVPTSDDASPPLHDTQAHLRAVHALLDSLPPEYRPTKLQTPTLPPPTMPELPQTPSETALNIPSLSEDPEKVATVEASIAAAFGSTCSEHVASDPDFEGGGPQLEGQKSRLPELRRLVSSLNKVDQRLFSLGPGGSRASKDAENEEDGAGRKGVETLPAATSVNPSTNSDPASDKVNAERTQSAGSNTDEIYHIAASRLQHAWKVRSRRRKVAAAAKWEACKLRRKCRDEAAAKIQAAHRRAQARYLARAQAEESRRWERRKKHRAAACAMLEIMWKNFQTRRRATRELAEVRARVAAIAAAKRRAENTARSATVLQAIWRGKLARVSMRRSEISRATFWAGGNIGQSKFDGAVTSTMLPDDQEAPHPMPQTNALRLSGPALRPRQLSLGAPSTFYNQLSQDPRRHHRLPDTHVGATMNSLPSTGRHSSPALGASLYGARKGVGETKGGRPKTQSNQFGPRPPLAQSAGAVRPLRFADRETERIARIMKGNLHHWAGVRSSGGGSSSSDDFNI